MYWNFILSHLQWRRMSEKTRLLKCRVIQYDPFCAKWYAFPLHGVKVTIKSSSELLKKSTLKTLGKFPGKYLWSGVWDHGFELRKPSNGVIPRYLLTQEGTLYRKHFKDSAWGGGLLLYFFVNISKHLVLHYFCEHLFLCYLDQVI